MKTIAPNILKLNKSFIVGIFLFQFNLGFTQSITIDSYIENYMHNNNIPGCAALVVKQGRIVYEKYFGYANLETKQPVTHNTIYMLASTSKLVTATAIMNENENGSFNLTDSIDSHLPFIVRNPNHPNVPITFRQLLTHTSSIKDTWSILSNCYYPGDSPIDFYSFFNGYLTPSGTYYTSYNYSTNIPGTSRSYCNVGIALLGYLTEQLTDKPFNQYCNDSIFSPLCMNNTCWFLSGLDTTLIARPYSYYNNQYHDNGLYGYPDYPDGQLRTTLVSLAKFMQMYINYGKFNDYRIMDSITVEKMNSVQFPTINSNQGLVFHCYNHGNDTIWGHSGSDRGVCTQMGFNKANKTGAIVLMNGDYRESTRPIINKMLDYAAEIPFGTGSILDCDFITSTDTIIPSPDSSITSALSHQIRTKNIVIYPNPGSGLYNIDVSMPGSNTYIEIFNIIGSLVRRKSILQEHNSFDLSNQPAGFYYIQVIQNKNIIGNQIIIKK